MFGQSLMQVNAAPADGYKKTYTGRQLPLL